MAQKITKEQILDVYGNTIVGDINASQLTGILPALDGSNLTNISAGSGKGILGNVGYRASDFTTTLIASYTNSGTWTAPTSDFYVLNAYARLAIGSGTVDSYLSFPQQYAYQQSSSLSNWAGTSGTLMSTASTSATATSGERNTWVTVYMNAGETVSFTSANNSSSTEAMTLREARVYSVGL